MHAVKKERRLENKKNLRIKKEGIYRWYKKKSDKIGIGYESLHIMELISV